MNAVFYPRRPYADYMSSLHAHSGIFESLRLREAARRSTVSSKRTGLFAVTHAKADQNTALQLSEAPNSAQVTRGKDGAEI
jgi:hypothetical protein